MNGALSGPNDFDVGTGRGKEMKSERMEERRAFGKGRCVDREGGLFRSEMKRVWKKKKRTSRRRRRRRVRDRKERIDEGRSDDKRAVDEGLE